MTPPVRPAASVDSSDYEDRITLAVAAIECAGMNALGQPNLSIREASKAFNVSKSTLSDRLNGKSTKAKAREPQQKLCSEAEAALVDWIKIMGRRGLPMSASTIIDCAADLCKMHIGQSWVKRFRRRHPELKPCDVGVFGPLARSWKAEVNTASAELTVINKHNLLAYYDNARQRALKASTIQAAFARTGIWPFNPDAIPTAAFDPSLLTTTQPALPLAPIQSTDQSSRGGGGAAAIESAAIVSAVTTAILEPGQHSPQIVTGSAEPSTPAPETLTSPAVFSYTPAAPIPIDTSSGAHDQIGSIETVHALPLPDLTPIPPPPPYYA
ncbi:hypothetical protein OE88DRAFT_1811454 [Heliocybe sulcata]|uniref:HTH CENPB-type domain-containing protein n=1 Tax=Heliocybe sulcata TaxID=5364 RepID=A0A5C3MN90_9AGAM|nr:hypothetical protein OE88DRAFT_1811454 [Heliocybe sulcata]